MPYFDPVFEGSFIQDTLRYKSFVKATGYGSNSSLNPLGGMVAKLQQVSLINQLATTVILMLKVVTT